ncbi:unnamed protein product, partial [Meganyctiphanes norvegica]
IESYSLSEVIPEVPQDPNLVKVLHEAFQREVFHPTETDWQYAKRTLESKKQPKIKSMKEIYEDMDKALSTNKEQEFTFSVMSIVFQLALKKCSEQRGMQLDMENEGDHDLPTKQNRYINDSFVVDSGENEFECTVCNTIFATQGSLTIHMRLHTSDKPFICATCGLKFRMSDHSKAHAKPHANKHCKICKSAENETVTSSANKNSQSSSEEGMEIVSGNGDAVVDVVSSVKGMNQVMLNPDRTMSLQIKDIGCILQNLGHDGTVTLDEQVLSQLQASGVV